MACAGYRIRNQSWTKNTHAHTYRRKYSFSSLLRTPAPSVQDGGGKGVRRVLPEENFAHCVLFTSRFLSDFSSERKIFRRRFIGHCPTALGPVAAASRHWSARWESVPFRFHLLHRYRSPAGHTRASIDATSV